MASKQHQQLVNALALALEKHRGITITSIDIDGDPQFFEEKYRNLGTPVDHNGIPDLQGTDSNGVIHLGEAEIDVNDSNVEEQLRNFSDRVMSKTKQEIPLHVIVPKEIRDDMESKIRQIGLDGKLNDGRITVWS